MSFVTLRTWLYTKVGQYTDPTLQLVIKRATKYKRIVTNFDVNKNR